MTAILHSLVLRKKLNFGAMFLGKRLNLKCRNGGLSQILEKSVPSLRHGSRIRPWSKPDVSCTPLPTGQSAKELISRDKQEVYKMTLAQLQQKKEKGAP